ncbi:MAG: GNAT family N-acetyltransferase [Acaryochloridaceae cyanobacterium SU_2_1]|nr:GNAT family N-acetyltransferase [Acaryochloridaceae cyanobacterium SU_2_1]NJM95023.1 GNAT family N-acetyltransferase [Acaryochloridaceae cyanobacterium CSU_5_19]
MDKRWRALRIRNWQPQDRDQAAGVIQQVLQEYGLAWEPQAADRDVLEVETAYEQIGGEFWVVEQADTLVGTAAYYPVARGEGAVEIRKMYLLPQVRGQGLGRWLLQQLEAAVAQQGYQQIWIETATVLQAAVYLYEGSGYEPATGVETQRCDRIYTKHLGALELEHRVL